MSEKQKVTPGYFKELDPDITDQEAESLAKRWNFQRPNNPERDLKEAQRGHQIEHEWRVLLKQRNVREMTQKEYEREMERRTGN
jgi:hypothetical protein